MSNQDPSDFDVVARKSGNSIVITIPSNLVKAHNIVHGTRLNAIVRLMGESKENPQ